MVSIELFNACVSSSPPPRDTLLQRYAILIGRVQSLTSYISQPPVQRGAGAGGPGAVRPPPPPGPGVTGATTPAETASALAHYLVHPLHPLPSDASPMANDTLLQAINTQLLPSVSGAQEQLLAPADGDGEGPHPAGFLPLDELNRLDEPALTRLTNELKNRLARESHRAQAMKREIKAQFDQYDWAIRLDDAADEGAQGDEDDDDDDLFGGDEDDDGDATMATAKADAPPPIPNPRAGWTVTDYLRLLDTGRGPTPAAPSTAAAAPGAAAATSQPTAAPATTAA